MTLHEDVQWTLRTVAAHYRAAGKYGDDVPPEWLDEYIEKLHTAILARHPEPTVSDGERGGMIATLDAVDTLHDFDSGDIPSTTTYADALLAAGYRKAPVVSVEDVARVIAPWLSTTFQDPDGWETQRATDIATAVLALLKGEGRG